MTSFLQKVGIRRFQNKYSSREPSFVLPLARRGRTALAAKPLYVKPMTDGPSVSESAHKTGCPEWDPVDFQ